MSLEALRSLPAGEQQGLALFATHGVADAGSTLLATAAIGADGEANPVVAALLAQGWGFAAGAMLAVSGAVAVTYPRLRELGELPDWFGWGLVVIGVLVAAGNLAVAGGVL